LRGAKKIDRWIGSTYQRYKRPGKKKRENGKKRPICEMRW
jgi:hypothetical protein